MKIRLHRPDPLTTGERTLSGAHSHYLARVLRVRVGQVIFLFNGEDGEWRAEIRAVHSRATRVRCDVCVRPPAPEPGPTLLFAPIRKSRLGSLLAMATELGVATLQPLITRNTCARLGAPERLERQLVESTEQCERLSVPTLMPAMKWPTFLQTHRENPVSLLACVEAGDARAMDEVLADSSAMPEQILIGPEGGLTEDERATLASLPLCEAVSLGSRILRSETAVAAALTQWQLLAGHCRVRPDPTPPTDD